MFLLSKMNTTIWLQYSSMCYVLTSTHCCLTASHPFTPLQLCYLQDRTQEVSIKSSCFFLMKAKIKQTFRALIRSACNFSSSGSCSQQETWKSKPKFESKYQQIGLQKEGKVDMVFAKDYITVDAEHCETEMW